MKQYFKRFLCIILKVVMVATLASLFVLAASALETTKTGDVIEFGSYPQTKVTDIALISALNSQTLQSDSTVTYGGAKYKKVYFTVYTSKTTTGTPDASNSYQDDNGYYIKTIYWFKFESLQWRVLTNINGELFVMAEKILDSKAYNQDYIEATWETCTVRSWLNNDFLNIAFNSAEQARINTSTLVNEDNPWYWTDGGNDTNDKLFLLSYSETINTEYGFNSSYSNTNAARQTKGTDYSKSQGLYVFPSGLYLGNSNWWLRSPGNYLDDAGVVGTSGIVHYSDTYDGIYTCFGVRPAFKINLTSVIARVSFNSAGGSAIETITQDYGTSVAAPTPPTKTGYTFGGWLPVVPSKMPATATNCVAQWTINKYSISFDSAGGSAVNTITQDYGTAIATPTPPTKTGYTFTGWLPVVPSIIPAKATNCVAQWTKNKYAITFDSTGGSAIGAITQDYGTVVATPTPPTKTGYTFGGWLPVVPSTMPATATNCVAQWTINKYSISFDSAGGSAVNTITQDYGTVVATPTPPTKKGYTFTGWLPVVPSTMPATATTCVAQWRVITVISIDKASLSMQYKSSATLTVAVSPYQSVIWTTSNKNAVTVDGNGNVTAVGSGSAIITATTANGLSAATCKVTVNLVWWQWIIRIILFGFVWY